VAAPLEETLKSMVPLGGLLPTFQSMEMASVPLAVTVMTPVSL
jgi:hypothetical protein